MTETLEDVPGAALPARVMETQGPVWIRNLAEELDAPRCRVAEECGLGGAIGVPVIGSWGIEGVLEFLAPGTLEADDRMLDLISFVGLQLGAALDYARAEDALRVSEARLREAQNIAQIGSWSWNAGEDEVSWSEGLFRVYGLPPSEGPVDFAAYLDHVDPEDRPAVQAAVQAVLSSGSPYEHDYRIRRLDGETRWVHARIEVAAHDGDGTLRLAGFCQDVTAAKDLEEKRSQATRDLQAQQRTLASIAMGEPLESILDELCRQVEGRHQGARCSVLLADADGLHLRHAAAPSLPPAFVEAIDGLPVGIGSGACGHAAATADVVVVRDALDSELTVEFTGLAQAHDLRSVWSHPLISPEGEILGTFAVYRRVPHEPDESEVATVMSAGSLAALAIERELAKRALLDAARLDPLTGLPNRAWFLQQLSNRLAAAERTATVMLVGLDRFKFINDSLGHPMGDRVLVGVARRLRDVLDEEEVLARFAGDTFAVLPRSPSAEVAARLASGIEAALQDPFELDGGEFFLSASVGIATNDRHADADALIRDADSAMFAAKDLGRGRHAMFDEGLLRRTTERLALEGDMRRAIDRDEFVMHFQPVVDLATYSWVGAEALVRWPRSAGAVGPDKFVPLAEETGLIIPLGHLILDHTISQMAAWTRGGHALEVSANLSVLQLSDPSLAEEVLSRLERAGIEPRRLTVEVTETAVMEHLDLARATLDRLDEAGVRIVIDDFGTGYSSIARLGDLPVVGIKIDRRFTARLTTEEGADRVVGAIIDLAHALGLQVVAEGIETEDELARVVDLGCDMAQGYLFSRPVAADSVLAVVGGPVPRRA